DDDLDALQLLDLGVPRGRHGPAQGADEVGGAVRHLARAEEDLLERSDRADLDARATWQLTVVGLGAPVVATAGGISSTGERSAEHDGIGAARDRLDDVSARPEATVRDDVDVAAARLVEVVATRGRDIGDGAGHRGVD